MSAATFPEIQNLSLLAADYIREHGWTQCAEQDQEGCVCLTGALRMCSLQPGDWLVARAVYRKREHAEDWNDSLDPAIGEREVIKHLGHSPVADADIAETFGPQWAEIVTLIRRVATMTEAQTHQVKAAGDAALGAAGAAVLGAAGDAALGAAGAAAWTAAWAAAREAPGASAPLAWAAAGEAARALVLRDLIGQHGFTQAHYDTLTAPLANAIGPIHPDDEATS